MAAASKGKFFSRLFKFKHMEFDSALQQLAWALISPKKLYRHHETQYKTRETWSRDDPAFLLCICAFLFLSSIGYSLILRVGVVGLILSIFWTVLIDCILTGVLMATFLWLISNHFFLKKGRDKVEWFYCFDVHLNSFVPLALIVFGIQMPLIGVLQHKTVLFTVISDLLWTCGICSYIYSTFLGYSIMSQLQNTVILLSPVLPILAMGVVSIPLKWNYSHWFATYYQLRVGSG